MFGVIKDFFKSISIKPLKNFFKNITFDNIGKYLSKLTLNSIPFISIVSFYFAFILNLSFWRFFLEKVEIFSSFSLFIFFISLLFLVFIIMFLIFNLITIPYIDKTIIILLLIISSSSNYYMFTYGVFIDVDMIRNIFETNQREALDLITFKSSMWILITGIAPAIIIFFTKINYSTLLKELKIRFIAVAIAFLTIGLFAIISYKEYASFFRNNREIRKLINTINYNYSLFRYFQAQTQSKREFVKIDENAVFEPYENTINKKVFVLVIGETARSANFSLYGYKQNTNPLLEKKDIIVFKDTVSCATSTAVSLPCIFSLKGRKDFDVMDEKYRENLVDLLQKAGYDVVWFENDDGCKGVCKRIENYNVVKENNEKYCFGDYCLDETLLDSLENKMKNIDKNTVIILHTMGSHGPTYYKRYTNEFKKFEPTCETADIQGCSRESILNTYDNTILYTDFILSSVIDILDRFDNFETGMLYVSDHGESLGENNIYLHGLPYAIAPKEQKEVPMILWLSDNTRKQNHIDYNCLKNSGNTNSFSHDNLFHSVVSILNIKTITYDKNLDIFRNCRTKLLEYQE